MMSWLNLASLASTSCSKYSMADESYSSDYPSKGIDSSPILANSFSFQQESALEDYIYYAIKSEYVAVQLPERLKFVVVELNIFFENNLRIIGT